MSKVKDSLAEPQVWWVHVRIAAVTLAVLLVSVVGLVVALRCAGFLYLAFAHRNPLRAGWWGWIDGMSACLQQCRPIEYRHLLGSAVLALALVFGGPLFAWAAVRNQADTRELHGSARFATEREIRKARLL